MSRAFSFLPIFDGEGDRRAAVVEGRGACPSTSLRLVPLPKQSLGRN